MQATDLILVRHGETDWNRELRFQGHIDVPLNAAGFEQAERLGRALVSEPIQRVIASDLERARQTAAPAARGLGLPVLTMPGLREQHFGVAEGLQAADILRDHGSAWDDWRQFREHVGMPGGESPRQFHDRILAALREIAAAYSGQHLLVVTHGGALDMVWRAASGRPVSGPRECDIPNAGINRLRVQMAGDRLDAQVLGWAEVAHLDGLPGQAVYPRVPPERV